MSSVHPLPKTEEMNNAVTMLYTMEAGVSVAQQIDVEQVSHFAVYVNDDDEPVAGIGCTLSFAAYAGSALSMIPKGGADDAVQCNELSEMMLGNLNEFMNICSRWFMTSDSPHIRLTETYAVGDLPEDAQHLLQASQRLDFLVDIPSYGAGQLVCVAT